MPRSARLAHSCRKAPASLIGLLVVSLACSSALAQLPQARITSLSRAGVRAGESVEVTLRGSDLEGATALWFDHPGLKAAHVKDLTFRVSCEPDVSLGHHDVRAVGTFGVSNPRVFVVGDRPEQVESEPNDTPDRATPIATGSVVNGEVSAATQVDYLSFEGRKGRRLFLDLEAERIDSRLDATLRILTPAGKELAENRDTFGADPFLDFTPPADGRYLIKIHDAVYAGSADHIYRLKIHEGPHVDAILPLAIAPGKGGAFTVIGRGLTAGAAPAGPLKVEGSPVESRPLSIAEDDRAALQPDRLFGFIPSSSGLFINSAGYLFVRPGALGASPTASAPFPLALTADPVIVEHEPNDEDAQAQRVTLPCDISATFGAPGDADLYRFEGRKGEVWKIEAIAERQGSPADPVLLVQKVRAKGEPPQDLATGDDLADAGLGVRFNTQSVDAEARLQVPEDGTYQVQVSDLYSSQRGDPRLTYRLVIRREQPDFRLVVLPASATATDGVTVRAGGRATAYVAAQRRDGFNGAIRVEARELPPGVRCSPVVIGPGQALAPVVFEAGDDAKTGFGPVTLVGRTRFGDRKDEVGDASGTSVLGADLVRESQAGGIVWPPPAATAAICPARLFRGFLISVRGEPAPLTLTARPETAVVAQGRQLKLDLSVARRAGFVEAVAVAASELPPNIPAANVTIAKDVKAGTLPLFIPRNVPPGTYSFVVRGSGPYPFNKDPKAKEKPAVTLSEPSNPITITVRLAPVQLAVDNKGGNLKQGQQIEVEVTITRQNGFAGPITLALNAPEGSKLSTEPITLPPDQSKKKLLIKAAKDSPAGAVANATIRATQEVRGERVEVDEPLALTVAK
ncbi:MAG: PPC domain-containing protein [Isosphaeraceae bacterium]